MCALMVLSRIFSLKKMLNLMIVANKNSPFMEFPFKSKITPWYQFALMSFRYGILLYTFFHNSEKKRETLSFLPIHVWINFIQIQITSPNVQIAFMYSFVSIDVKKFSKIFIDYYCLYCVWSVQLNISDTTGHLFQCIGSNYYSE